jgi:hypothetical protein
MVSNVQERYGIPDKRTRISEADKSGGAVMFEAEQEAGTTMRLWDILDEGWTKPWPVGQAIKLDLRKVVSVCSVCRYAGPFEHDVRSHIGNMVRQGERHKDGQLSAVVIADGGRLPMRTCMSCGQELQISKSQDEQHLHRMKKIAPLHVDATILTMRRYSLEPQEFPEPNGAGKPVDIQAERSTPPPTRGGRRRRQRRNRR